eukprot:14066008-Alexandrium_andersonii.AAC.1
MPLPGPLPGENPRPPKARRRPPAASASPSAWQAPAGGPQERWATASPPPSAGRSAIRPGRHRRAST